MSLKENVNAVAASFRQRKTGAEPITSYRTAPTLDHEPTSILNQQQQQQQQSLFVLTLTCLKLQKVTQLNKIFENKIGVLAAWNNHKG